MTIGFIGTGNIASALVRGLCASARPPSRILVSPRNTEKAARLAAEFAQVRVAATNQAVVDESDTVILSVLPQAAEKILGALAFRTGQRIVSLIAMTPLDLTRRLVSRPQAWCAPFPCPRRRAAWGRSPSTRATPTPSSCLAGSAPRCRRRASATSRCCGRPPR